MYSGISNPPLSGYWLETSMTGITAKAGGGQAGATQLNAQTNRIDTVTSVNDSVMLPVSVNGLEITVINNTNNMLTVYGSGTDTVNGGPYVAQPPNSVDMYVCGATGTWHVETGVGYSGSLFCESAQDNGCSIRFRFLSESGLTLPAGRSAPRISDTRRKNLFGTSVS